MSPIQSAPPSGHASAISFERFETGDVDQLTERMRPLERHAVQLGAGAMTASIARFAEGAIKIVHERYESPLALSGAPPASTRSFALLTAATGSPRFCGRAMQVGEIAVTRPGVEWHVRTQRVCEWINVVVDVDALRARAQELGLPDPEAELEGAVLLARPSFALRLRAAERRARHDGKGDPSRAGRPGIVDGVLTDVALGSAGERDGIVARTAGSTVRHRAVARALDYLRELAPPAPSIADLCRCTGVSARTLEYAFQERFGVTPARFLKLYRLGAADRALRRRDPRHSSVTEIATEHGFWDLGHFARDYRLLFGEPPGHVLRGVRPSSDAVPLRFRADFS